MRENHGEKKQKKTNLCKYSWDFLLKPTLKMKTIQKKKQICLILLSMDSYEWRIWIIINQFQCQNVFPCFNLYTKFREDKKREGNEMRKKKLEKKCWHEVYGMRWRK